MKSILILLIILCLSSCANYEQRENKQETWICKKEVAIKEKDGGHIAGNYSIGYVVMDGILNREVHVKEFMKESFSSMKEYEEYMKFLQDSCFLQLGEDSRIKLIMPYYESDRIVYPYLIFDYTDLEKYTETEVPTQVRTKDGKSIDFDLYWDYIQQNGVLDGFVCTLEK